MPQHNIFLIFFIQIVSLYLFFNSYANYLSVGSMLEDICARQNYGKLTQILAFSQF